MISAVLFDLGGVMFSSPFDAFNRHESAVGLPIDFIRTVNATDPHTNAWARFERSEVTAQEFDELFRAEALRLGHDVPGAVVLGLIDGQLRPEMVDALERVKAAGYKVAALTNNMRDESVPPSDHHAVLHELFARFDAVVESSTAGCRKPEPRFYELACELLAVAPDECVFLDDLGINLKPAAAMGMTTIKVLSAEQALTDLERVLGLALR